MSNDYLGGIDISHHQGAIDWKKVAATGVAFAFAKASEGVNTKDETFAANFAAMKDNGILRGAYHFFHPCKDPDAQADNFLAVVQNLDPGDLPPVLDVEIDEGKSAAEIIAGIQTWVGKVKAALGRTPVIYTSAFFWDTKVGGCKDFSDCPLWVAHYTSEPAPNKPKGFDDFTFWQYSQQGNIAGIAGHVDMNRFSGSMEELKKLAGIA